MAFRRPQRSGAGSQRMRASGGIAISSSQWSDGFGPDSGPSRGDSFRRAFRPIGESEAAVRYVRRTSTPAVREASTRIVRSLAYVACGAR
jgi:hypothetical protein